MRSDKVTRKLLKCASCIAVAFELHDGLNIMHEFRRGKPPQMVEVMENTCPRMRSEYGLCYAKKKSLAAAEAANPKLKKKMLPTAEDDNDILLMLRSDRRNPDLALQKVSWATNMVHNDCGKVIDKYEGNILDNYADLSRDEFTRETCLVWDEACALPPPSLSSSDDAVGSCSVGGGSGGEEGTCSGGGAGASDSSSSSSSYSAEAAFKRSGNTEEEEEQADGDEESDPTPSDL